MGFLCERFSTSNENDSHSRTIYRNDVIAMLVNTCNRDDAENALSRLNVLKVGDKSLIIHKSAYHLFSLLISKRGFLLCKRRKHSVRL